jgi:hypothetical protein
MSENRLDQINVTLPASLPTQPFIHMSVNGTAVLHTGPGVDGHQVAMQN